MGVQVIAGMDARQGAGPFREARARLAAERPGRVVAEAPRLTAVRALMRGRRARPAHGSVRAALRS